MSDSVWPQRWQPIRLPRPWDSPGKSTWVGCHFLPQCMKVKSEVKSLSHVRLLANPWTAAYQAPPSMGFSRQEDWSRVPLPSPLLKPSLKDFEYYLAHMWNGCNCTVVWTFFGIALLWDWNENWPFPVLWPLLSFPNLLGYWVQHFNNIIF